MTLSREQVAQLLHPIKPERVLHAQNMSHVSQQDVRAHLIRVFGFEGWDKEILDLRCVRDVTVHIPATVKYGKDVPARDVPGVTYLCRLRLTIRDPQGNVVKVAEDVGTGTSPNLPDYGDAHDFAAKNAVSYALKRCATDLGDQFGLSLYNKGQTSALVGGTLVWPDGEKSEKSDVQEGVPQQVDLGDERPAEQSEPQTYTHQFYGEDGEKVDPRHVVGRLEVPVEKRDEINRAKRRVKVFGERLGMDIPKLAVEFATFTEGGVLADAGLLQLQSFGDYLEHQAKAANGAGVSA